MSNVKNNKLEGLERILLFISLFLPPFSFILDGVVTNIEDDASLMVTLFGITITIGSLLLFFLLAIFNAIQKLRHAQEQGTQEAIAAKLAFMIFLLVTLMIASDYLRLPLTILKDSDVPDLPRKLLFLIYASLAIYFFFVNLNRLSKWLQEKAVLVVTFILFLFIFSWIFWLTIYARLENRVDDVEINNSQEWDTFGELANNIWDLSLLEEQLEEGFLERIKFQPSGKAVLLRIVPLDIEFGNKARLYFMDDKGIYRVNIDYTYDEKENWEITQESEVEVVRAIKF